MSNANPSQLGHPTLAYAAAEPKSHRVWACGALLFFSLGLIFLGGCFLIGVLLRLDPKLMFGPMTASRALLPADYAFMGLLTGLALEHFHLGCSVGLAGPLAARDVAGRERPG